MRVSKATYNRRDEHEGLDGVAGNVSDEKKTAKKLWRVMMANVLKRTRHTEEE